MNKEIEDFLGRYSIVYSDSAYGAREMLILLSQNGRKFEQVIEGYGISSNPYGRHQVALKKLWKQVEESYNEVKKLKYET